MDVRNTVSSVSNSLEQIISKVCSDNIRGFFHKHENLRILEVAKIGNLEITNPTACKMWVIAGFLKVEPRAMKTPHVVFMIESDLGKAVVVVSDLFITTYGAEPSFVLPDSIALAACDQTLLSLQALPYQRNKVATVADTNLVYMLLSHPEFLCSSVLSLD